MDCSWPRPFSTLGEAENNRLRVQVQTAKDAVHGLNGVTCNEC